MKPGRVFHFAPVILIVSSALVLASCAAGALRPSREIVAETAPYAPIAWTEFDTHDDPVRTLAMEGDDLWMGLMKGMIRFNPRQREYEIFTPANTKGGFVSGAVYVISIDSRGNKWVGTYGGGLSSFNGRTWKRYTTEDGLGDNWVYDIKYDHHGTMWVATWNGVSVFDGKRFRTYRVTDGLIDKWVYSIALDRNGIFWFGTEGGISRFDGKSWVTFTHEDGVGGDTGERVTTEELASPFPSATSNDPGGREEYGSGFMKHHMKAGKQNVMANPNFIISSVVDGRNRKWFGTWGAGVSVFDGTAWTNYTKKNGLGGNFIFTLVLDRDGRVWAGTNGGASWFDGTRWRTIDRTKGLLDNNVLSMLFDGQGRRWFGTAKGLSVFKGSLPMD
jgi:ligand-binding sensor domain-containing protein